MVGIERAHDGLGIVAVWRTEVVPELVQQDRRRLVPPPRFEHGLALFAIDLRKRAIEHAALLEIGIAAHDEVLAG
jgi:hypothetical protein